MIKFRIMKLVIATHNKDKLKELYHGLKDMNLNLLSLDDFPSMGNIVEDGNSLEENALIKARAVYNISGIPAISDDTGLEVDALDGKPGIHTARYAGENCSYIDNVNKMIKEMKNISWKDRTARFVTCIAYVDKHVELTAYGIVKGMIEKKNKSLGGFGYDPIFYDHEYKKTFSDMSIEQKNSISHRGKAIKAIKIKLIDHLNLLRKNA